PIYRTGPHDAASRRIRGGDERPAAVPLLVDRAAAAVDVVVARVARGEEHRVGVDDEGDAALESERAGEKGALGAVGAKDDRAAADAAIDRQLDTSRVRLRLVGVEKRRVRE